jgi:outer membrane protein assembly factor BamB
MVSVLKKGCVLSLVIGLAGGPASAGLRFGLGSAVAKRSAEVINQAGHTDPLNPANTTSHNPTPFSSRVIWHFAAPSGVTLNYSSPAIAPDGTVYFGTSGHFVLYNAYWIHGLQPPAENYGLYAYSHDGTFQWEYTDGTDAAVRGSPALASDGTIYVVMERLSTSEFATTQELHAVNPNGTQKWKVTLGNGYSEIGALTPSLASDGTIYVAGDNLYAVNPDGSSKWTASHGGSNTWYGAPAIGSDGTIYGVYWNLTQVVQAWNPDGTVKWTGTDDLGTIPISCSPSLAADGTIYIGSVGPGPGSNNGTLWAFDSTGAFKWKYNTGDYDVRTSPAIDADGTIYFGTKGNFGYIIALNPNGTLKWQHASADDHMAGIGTDVYASPAIGADGTIYSASESNWFYAFNPDGTLLWKDEKITPGGGVTWSSPAIASDGTLFVGSAYGVFSAVDTTSLGLKPTAQWPKFRYSLDNNGRQP